MSRTAKIAFACALGGLIGAALALEIAGRFAFGTYFCFVGMFVGGLTSYLTYEFKAVVTASARSYRELRGWQPNWKLWRDVVALFCLHAMWMATVALSFTFLVFLINFSEVDGPQISWARYLLLFGLIWFGSSGLATMLMYSQLLTPSTRNTLLRESRKTALHGNPLMAILWVGYGILYVAKKTPGWLWFTALPGLWRAVAFLGRVVWKTFRYIHSDIRALCFVDGMLGSGAGFYFGSPVAGAAAGLVFGVVNYAVVTKLFLRPENLRV